MKLKIIIIVLVTLITALKVNKELVKELPEHKLSVCKTNKNCNSYEFCTDYKC